MFCSYIVKICKSFDDHFNKVYVIDISKRVEIFFKYMTRMFYFFLIRYESNSGGEREIQRTMLELLNQLDGFDSKGDVKVSGHVLGIWNMHDSSHTF